MWLKPALTGQCRFPKSRAQLCQPTDDGLNTSFAETSLNEPRLSRNHANDHVEIDFSSDGYDIPVRMHTFNIRIAAYQFI